MSKTIIEKSRDDYAGLALEDTHNFLLMTIPLNPKGLPKSQKRLARIKRNLIRELTAFNKEMRRYPKESK